MKIFIISEDEDSLKDKSEMTNVEIIARIENKKLVTDISSYPPNTMRFTFNEINNWVTIEFQLKNNQVLALADKK